MRSVFALTIAAFVGTSALALISCGPAPKNPQAPLPNQVATTKPTSVSSSRVSLTALTEVSHIERALKPFLVAGGLGAVVDLSASTSEARELLAADYDLSTCRTTKTTTKAMWETRWNCGLTSTNPGKKEIEGVERANYDSKTMTLKYEAKFEIRNYDDREARSNAHTLVTTRRITATFASGAGTTATARVRMTSTGNIKAGDRARAGSNWRSAFEGTLSRATTGVWSLAPKSRIGFTGSLYGLDGERGTQWAAGDYAFVSESAVELQGLSDPSTCTKPIGNWTVSASGGGQNFDSVTQSSASGVTDSAGLSLAWPTDLCDQP